MTTRSLLQFANHQITLVTFVCAALFVEISTTGEAFGQVKIRPVSTDSSLTSNSETGNIGRQPAAPQDETIVPIPGNRQSIFGPLTPIWNTDQKHRITGFIDFNSYWDSRNFSNTSINLLANLPNDFQYFQLLNLEGPIDSGSHDLRNFFTEMNLRRKVSRDSPWLSHLDWTMQYADGTIPHGVLRFGCRCRVQDSPGTLGRFFKDVLKLNYSINFHFLETDSTGWQIEQVYRRQFLDGKIYVAGFCDHNIDNGGRNSTWVTEHQIGLQVFDAMYLVAEHRYNSFFPSGSRQGMGIGLEYVMRFK